MITLQSLPYSRDLLQPTLSDETINFHYDKHHKGYVDKLNKLIHETKYESKNLEEIIKESYVYKDHMVFNNAAQIWNHDFYWKSITEYKEVNVPSDDLLVMINENFTSLDDFYTAFINAGATLFGSGWIWLVQDPETLKLEIIQSKNADNPLIYNKVAILTIDVWEHAYYIDYKNDRLGYLDKIVKFNLNWDFAKSNITFEQAE
jgi:Fe-Mn family superoxide dismutase